MKKILKLSTAITAFLAATMAFASVARSTTGQGPSKDAAMADAKNAATRIYGNSVTSWGDATCSSRMAPKNQYDQTPVLTWFCQVDFTTSK